MDARRPPSLLAVFPSCSPFPKPHTFLLVLSWLKNIHHERTITMKTFLKVLVALVLTFLFFLAAIPFFFGAVLISDQFEAELRAFVPDSMDLALMYITQVLPPAIILCIIDLATHNYLKNYFEKSLLVYIIQSGSAVTLLFFISMFSKSNLGDEQYAYVCVCLTIILFGGVLLSAIIRTIKQRRTKNE